LLIDKQCQAIRSADYTHTGVTVMMNGALIIQQSPQQVCGANGVDGGEPLTKYPATTLVRWLG
jgi:hypothetical protein